MSAVEAPRRGRPPLSESVKRGREMRKQLVAGLKAEEQRLVEEGEAIVRDLEIVKQALEALR